tara:strand:+ start:2129 stop:2686 length:558 start_codon:yes stop_codon:yes gene_type:complete
MPSTSEKKSNFRKFLDWYHRSISVRMAYVVFALLSVTLTVGTLLYNNYWEHRIWTTERVADSYNAVELAQGEVFSLAVNIIPSRRTGDRHPTEQQKRELLTALDNLAVSVSKVDVNEENLSEATAFYRDRINNLAKAVIKLSESDPRTYSDLLRSADEWDFAAQKYGDAVEKRINSYFATLWPST